MKKVYKKSDLLREGYVKGLKEARRIICEAISCEDEETRQPYRRLQDNEPAAWAGVSNAWCKGESPYCDPPSICVWLKKRFQSEWRLEDEYSIDSVTYDEAADRIIFKSGRTTFYLNEADATVRNEEKDLVPSDRIEVDLGEGNVMTLAELYKDDGEMYDTVEFVGFPDFLHRSYGLGEVNY